MGSGAGAMKDTYEVLYHKESDLARVRKEVASLTLAAQLLADDELPLAETVSLPDGKSRKPAQKVNSPEQRRTDGKSFVWPRSDFWGSLRLRR
jgi:hypothetical protein